jgi:filamentous hemagglutinin
MGLMAAMMTTNALPEGGYVRSERIRFTQDSIKSTFKDGRSVQGLIDDLKAGRVTGDDVPPIRVFERNGELYSLDNRRLYAFQEVGVPIRTIPATAEEVAAEAWKFTTKNDGLSIRVRSR